MVPSTYFRGRFKTPFLLNASEESTQPLFPLHRFRLRQWPFTSSCLCRFPLWPAVLRRAGGVAPFFSPSWIWENSLYCNCSQLQVYKSAFESFLSLALLSLFVSSFSVLCFWFVSVVSFPSKVLFCILSIFQGLSFLLHTDSSYFFLPRCFLSFTTFWGSTRGLYSHPVNVSIILFPSVSLWREQQPWTEEKRPGFRLISQLNRWPLTPLSLSLSLRLFHSVCLYRFIPRSHRGQQFCFLSFCNLSSWFLSFFVNLRLICNISVIPSFLPLKHWDREPQKSQLKLVIVDLLIIFFL